jgi:hypothetical protein
MVPGPDQARRYGDSQRRLCARPGCGAEAEAWLVDVDEHATRTHSDVCARHADALVLPRGWELRDARTSTSAGAWSRCEPPPIAAVPNYEPEPEPEPVTAHDALATVFDARSPLLKRAFENVWPLEGS